MQNHRFHDDTITLSIPHEEYINGQIPVSVDIQSKHTRSSSVHPNLEVFSVASQICTSQRQESPCSENLKSNNQQLFAVAAVFITSSLSAPLDVEARACAATCGTVCYTSSAVSAAKAAGYKLYSAGSTASSYPHVYHDYEGFVFPVSGTYYEFPILKSGSVYSGGSPGADRVIFNTNNQLAGVITHTGASGNNFVECS
ncbi:unnamed protein product [Penicillium salamii]|uniref:ribonuclease T1 n=1 Tax=Penicillium salamii TaxID=1612424 RepID=A0A9W4K3K6_9EURO|nr:unnamed protein product [Penicillium salamii]CAG8025172.1 unnamed protein product [Penicillium salamii]CAG8131785.1 unnamed protein product [Penicillium salamii]CAG8178051.1 unnamed protein product [Penicillium salamii]CAG8213181.1 unnamed protein product [Penicillium salamii]